MDELLRSIQRATSGQSADDYTADDLLRLLSAAEDAMKTAQPPLHADSTTRFQAFRAALDDLCTRHGIQLTVSQYDGLQAWPLRPDEPPVYSQGFENCIPDGPNVELRGGRSAKGAEGTRSEASGRLSRTKG